MSTPASDFDGILCAFAVRATVFGVGNGAIATRMRALLRVTGLVSRIVSHDCKSPYLGFEFQSPQGRMGAY